MFTTLTFVDREIIEFAPSRLLRKEWVYYSSERDGVNTPDVNRNGGNNKQQIKKENQVMKTRTQFFFALLLLVAIIVGCGQRGEEGIYIGEEGSYIEIKPDGSFYTKNIRFTDGSFEAEDSRRRGGGLQLVGKYQWEEGGITFIFDGGRAVRGQILDDVISVGGGSSDERWVYWRPRKSGMDYEKMLSNIQTRRQELERLPDEGKITYQEYEEILSEINSKIQELNQLVHEGKMSPGEAKEKELDLLSKALNKAH